MDRQTLADACAIVAGAAAIFAASGAFIAAEARKDTDRTLAEANNSIGRPVPSFAGTK